MSQVPQDKRERSGVGANRVFEQPPDAMVCYADIAQILATDHEVILQFYESIPGPPSPPSGQISIVRTRLRASVILSLAHARNMAENLLKQAGSKESKPAEPSR
jgi:hypothetical protein